MINLIQSTSKWPKILQSGSAYQQSFNQAILNFEKNVKEEGDGYRSTRFKKNWDKKKGTRN